MLVELGFDWRAGSVPKTSAINCRGTEIILPPRILRVLTPPHLLLQMESSGSSSSVSDPQARTRPTEGNEVLIEASKDLLRAHVRLMMARVLTMEESKPTL